MKLTHLLVLSLGLSLSAAFAGETEDVTYTGLHLAPNLTVSKTQEGEVKISGWYDADKTRAEDTDDMMCYAASASNLLAWWYDSDKAVASDAPTDHKDIWNTFRNNNQEVEGGFTLCAINWWISGVYAPCSQQDDKTWTVAQESDPMWDRSYLAPSDFGDAEGISVTLPNYKKDGADWGGYYYDQYGLTKEDLSDFMVEVWSYADPETPDDDEATSTNHSTLTLGEVEITEDEGIGSICDVDFVEIFEDSAIGLGIYSEDGELAHAITLWGVEYDADGNLTTLWLTDSDDYINQIFSVTVTLDEEANKIYFGELVGEGQDAHYYTKAYEGYEDIYIGGIYALDTEAALKWQLVTEPTTATLSLLALESLVTRRRRK